MSLQIQQSLSRIERVLVDALSFAFKQRKVTAADAAALRAVRSMGDSSTPTFINEDLAYVTSKGNIYTWAQSSTSTDDGDSVLKPADAGATGRWLKVSTPLLYEGDNVATLPGGLVREVILHNGDFDDEVVRARIYNRRPCMAIHFAGGRHETVSQVEGALYDYRVRFEVWSVSRNYREKYEAALGSEVPVEVATDPGVMLIHGFVKGLLGGTSGEDLNETGIKFIHLADEEMVESNSAERIFVMSQSIEVLASINHLDAAKTLSNAIGVNAQFNQSSAPPGGKLGVASDCVTLGLRVPPSATLTATIEAGSALVGTAAVSVLAAPTTFQASSDTYRDLTPAGTWVLTAVRNGAGAPRPAAGNLRVGVTVTDQSSVLADALVCSAQIPYPAANSPDDDPIGVDPLEVLVVPLTLTLGVGGQSQLVAIARRPDGSEQDITAVSAWSSSDASKVSVTSGGLAAGVAVGSATLTATYGSRSGSIPATVM